MYLDISVVEQSSPSVTYDEAMEEDDNKGCSNG